MTVELECGKCRFWRFVREDYGSKRGECRRNAPVPQHVQYQHFGRLLGHIAWILTQEHSYPEDDLDFEFGGSDQFNINEWPRTFDDDWCGEWAALDEQVAQ